VRVHALAHITGGGLTENLPRVLPAKSKAVIERNAWALPPVFEWLQSRGNIAESEMLRTFNCGVGMVACVSPDDVAETKRILEEQGETVFELGRIEASDKDEAFVEYV
jgi:phosphoribosylformylglycinamidine cyclo-ligase